MNLEPLWNAFVAFNQNAANHIAYSFVTNKWLILFVLSAVACVILGVKEETATTVQEEQNIL